MRQVVSITDDLGITVRNVNKLMGAIKMLRLHNLGQNQVISLESAIIEMTADSGRFFAGLDELLDNKLSMELVSDKSMRKEFGELKRDLAARSFDTVFDSHAQVYQLPATFRAVNGSVIVMVKVPVIPARDRDEYHLFQHLALPVSHDGHLVRVVAEGSLLAVSQDRAKFVELTSSEVSSCNRMGDYFLCPYVSVINQGSAKTCLQAIFLGDSEVMKAICEVRFLRQAFRMNRINDTAFQIYSSDRVTVSVTCEGDTQVLRSEGLRIISVKRGCIAFVEGATFLSALRPVVEVQHVVTLFPEDFLMGENYTIKEVQESLDGFDFVDLKALQGGKKVLEGYTPWSVHGYTSWWVYAVGVASVVLLLLFLAACVYYRRRLFILWKLTHKSEGAVAWHKSRAPQLIVGEEINSLRSEIRGLKAELGKEQSVNSDVDEDLSEEGTLDSMILE